MLIGIMGKRALFIISDGFEDIETVVPIDVLTRLGVNVTVAGLRSRELKGAWGSSLLADVILDEEDKQTYDALILPGGKKNALFLASSALVRQNILDHYNSGKIVAAICASPSHVLGEAAQLLKGKRVTGDPEFSERLQNSVAIYTNE
ncbi:MAG: DJ-1/PfpI family protein, partial [SAR324 cluster bacterium]|nr:DJ-1/PfpI family protein [SAR324 cluster bacterium]